ncbi:LytTR family DNA-binding domain-containing protein [Roseovarius sp. CAU 1744]|uniref:LytTR family DNA-binding domain-containing protein n=1 Tax=Roseovarius sp. CAU 1744 TaxID=3140368 RepID=UPI00325BC1F8
MTSILIGTIAGPFGTYFSMDWPDRGLYWTLLVSASIVTGYTIRAISLSLIGKKHPLLLDATFVVLTAFVFGPVVWLMTWYFLPTGEVEPVPVFAAYVMLCAAIIVAGRRVMPGIEDRSYGFLAERGHAWGSSVRGGARPPRLMRRLSVDKRGRVLRLSANDHMVKVVTANGEVTLRMRLADAVAEMEPVYGYCVHRSHWVAHEAIDTVEKENSYKLFVVLANGDRIPVSRKYRVNVKQAGLI